MLSQLWILTSAILSKKTNYFTVYKCKVLPNIVCFSNFAFRLLEITNLRLHIQKAILNNS